MKKELGAEDRGRSSKFGGRLFCGLQRVSLLVLLFVTQAPAASSAPAATAKNVLVLYSFSDRNVSSSASLLESALRSRLPWPVNLNLQYLESERFKDESYQKSLVETLRYTYEAQTLDLIIASSYPALQFAIEHRDALSPGVPIVFYGVSVSRIAGQSLRLGVTGVTMTVGVQQTVDLALHLHPKANVVAIVTNNSDFEKFWLAIVHAELLRHRDRVTEIDLVGLPTGRLLERVAALPPQTIILFQESAQDSVRPALGVYDTLGAIGQLRPTYCVFPVQCLNHGGIGGASYSIAAQMPLTAELAKRVLSGERAETIPIVHESTNQIQVDWRQLRRWNIPDSALPPGSLVLYREPTLWERDRNYIIAAIVLIVAQSLSIIGLLMQRARKREAEAVVAESEKRFRTMADTTPSLIWMCDQEGKVTYLNERRLAFTGRDPSAGYGDTWTRYVHPDDVKQVLGSMSQALKKREPFSKEYRLRRNDGVYRWMFDVASPRVNGDSSFAGFIGSAIDITDQKLAQEALEGVSGRLIEAQEKERSRIARDLHDDICQRLALLSMELEQANRNGAPPSTKKYLREIQQHCAEITGDIQSLSHHLHSSKLEYLGIVAAIRSFCNEFAKQHDVSIDFRDENVPTHLPKDISLCLFRVAQEGLQNAVKYSGAIRFSVDVRSTGDEIQLAVSDAGEGFDVEQVKRNRGLGLVSMQERVHLVHGRFNVESRPGGGTRIVAVVPVVAISGQSSADGESNKAASVTGAA